MVKNMRRFALMLCVLVLCVSALATAALAAAPVTAHIPVKVTLSGPAPQEPENFVIRLTPVQASNPMPADSVDGVYSTTISGAGSALIEITYSRVGVYDYTVKQVSGDNRNCIYDAAEYQVTVFVTNSETGGLDVTVVAYRDGAEDKSDIIFDNRYAKPASVAIEAEKTLDGKAPLDGSFSFVLEDESGDSVTVQNVGGKVVFPAKTYDAEGIYTYTLREVMGADKEIVYDQTVYTVTVVVTRNAEGDYEAQVSYLKNDKAFEGTPKFENKTVKLPTTGDHSHLGLYIAVFAAAAIAMAAVAFLMKRGRKQV